MDCRPLLPDGMTVDDLHKKIGGNRMYLNAVLAGWYKKPGIKLILAITKACPKIKASMLNPKLKGVE